MSIILNVETIASLAAKVRGPDPIEIDAPSNWIDDVKIKAKIAENRLKWEDRLPLDPLTAEVAGVGIAGRYKTSERMLVAIAAPETSFLKGMGPMEFPLDGDRAVEIIRLPTEYDLLHWTWEQLRQLREMGDQLQSAAGAGIIMGFGIREFGLPMLILRSIYRDVGNIGLSFSQLSKYRSWLETGVLDLQDYLRGVRATDRFALAGRTLKRYAEFFDLAVRPHGNPDEFPIYYDAENYWFCAKHIGHDLLTLRALLNRIGETLVE